MSSQPGEDDTDAEFAAMQSIFSQLKALDDTARKRVLDYVAARLDIAPISSLKGNVGGRMADDSGSEEAAIRQEEKAAPKYDSFAELHNDAQPKTAAQKALVAAYWLQVCEGQENFDGASTNNELKHLGERLENITGAFDTLKSQTPALALQLRKSGNSRQARKLYKLTSAGIKAVEAMIDG